jgi:uncharacterized membrane-anchored protein
MNQVRSSLSKVPEVTLSFWIIKILATTVGETAADFLNENLGIGLPKTSLIMLALFAGALTYQLILKRYVSSAYWLVVVFISVVGTLITDNLTDGLGVPLWQSSLVFLVLLFLVFLGWGAKEGTVSIHSINSFPREVFYWLAVLFTFALGTATGDLFAESFELGYLKSGLICLGIIGLISLIYRFDFIRESLAFWLSYILTRPLGASFGDYLSQAKDNGGLGLGTTSTTIGFVIAIFIAVRMSKADQINDEIST